MDIQKLIAIPTKPLFSWLVRESPMALQLWAPLTRLFFKAPPPIRSLDIPKVIVLPRKEVERIANENFEMAVREMAARGIVGLAPQDPRHKS